MSAPVIDAGYVVVAAAAAGVAIPDEHLTAVTGTLQRIAELAAPVLALPLEPEDEIAPVWRP